MMSIPVLTMDRGVTPDFIQNGMFNDRDKVLVDSRNLDLMIIDDATLSPVGRTTLGV